MGWTILVNGLANWTDYGCPSSSLWLQAYHNVVVYSPLELSAAFVLLARLRATPPWIMYNITVVTPFAAPAQETGTGQGITTSPFSHVSDGLSTNEKARPSNPTIGPFTSLGHSHNSRRHTPIHTHTHTPSTCKSNTVKHRSRHDRTTARLGNVGVTPAFRAHIFPASPSARQQSVPIYPDAGVIHDFTCDRLVYSFECARSFE
ncbi:uncharacterized protein K489DRAFT_373437 [Dissoconium aciculare CBS 342.82]|uniref:Uncharacterized protein n=1 Tax=Dissoconium aciculare CBS 342.82 TaxID=1314786 RepID=A0A6J3LV01_9PEZI|nr:uncharacterized protein K489DRAFT_373437 [Dissoconium aciculare CBS 342.82]KAF1819595.1 hypothetical protein K489DRAFT_373437 [Dissoconium aciculare CBS 342.82]